MPTYFQRPENALKRAHEFIDVEKPQRALDALYDVIKSKKHRTWQKIHEPIMEKYLELCVELKKSHVAKEGLYQYKNICQQVNVKSLEDVVRKYLQMAEDRTEGARLQSHQTVVDIDDLDVLQTPESLLLSAVSGEDTQDRADRAILTPWVKFLWESYRQCLDLLRNNSRVERLYQDVAQQAFQFCLKYSRKTEFRKLCDNLRTHLSHVINKPQHQQNAINLNNPESLQMHLETRLAQLDAGIKMELWQEAFKAVEDIHNLIVLSKKPPKPALMANYYGKFGLVFWKAGSHLFHAATWHRLLMLTKEQKKSVSQDELHRMSNRVLCATLAVPIPPTRYQIDQLLESNDVEKRRRLATLLGLANPPTRASLIRDLAKSNVLQGVAPELRNLYQWLEVDFHPLALASRLQQCLTYIEKNDDLAQYASALQEITVVRLIKQVAQVYQTIEFSRLKELAPFISAFQLERIVVQAAKNIDLPVRINHQTQSLSFGTDLNVCLQEDSPEGPFLQHMPGDQVRNQLQYMAQALHKAVEKLACHSDKTKDGELRQHIIGVYRQTAKKEHSRILSRRQIIEDRKEELEKITEQRTREEDHREAERQRIIREAEEERLKREMEERERQRKVQEHQEIKRQMAKERIEQLKKTEIGERALRGLDEEELADLDTDDILKKQVEQLEKEKKELAERLKAQEKKVDHFIRAKRLEELPLLEKYHEDDSIKNREFWEQQENDRIECAKKEREMAMQHKDRLTRMLADKNDYVDTLWKARHAVFVEQQKKFDKLVSDARKKALAERKEKRKEERRIRYTKEKEEATQKALEEQQKREKEEKEQMEKEKHEREEKEYKEKMAKLEAAAEKQRQREREIEEKLSREKQQLHYEDRSEKPSAWKPTAKGGWRDREQQRGEAGVKRDTPKEDGVQGDDEDSNWRKPIDLSTRDGDRDEKVWVPKEPVFGQQGERSSGLSSRPIERERDVLRGGRRFEEQDDAGSRESARYVSDRDVRDHPKPRESAWRDEGGPQRETSWRDARDSGRRDEVPKRDERESSRYDDHPRRDVFSRRGDEPPRRADDFTRRGDDFPPRRGDDFPPRRGDDFPPRRGDDFPPRRGDDFPPRRGDDFPPRRGDDFPPRRDDAPRRDAYPRREEAYGSRRDERDPARPEDKASRDSDTREDRWSRDGNASRREEVRRPEVKRGDFGGRADDDAGLDDKGWRRSGPTPEQPSQGRRDDDSDKWKKGDTYKPPTQSSRMVEDRGQEEAKDGWSTVKKSK